MRLIVRLKPQHCQSSELTKFTAERMNNAYIALYSCSVTRAIHLELVERMSAETLPRALRKFAARRGTPGLIVSDNADISGYREDT